MYRNSNLKSLSTLDHWLTKKKHMKLWIPSFKIWTVSLMTWKVWQKKKCMIMFTSNTQLIDIHLPWWIEWDSGIYWFPKCINRYINITLKFHAEARFCDQWSKTCLKKYILYIWILLNDPEKSLMYVCGVNFKV